MVKSGLASIMWMVARRRSRLLLVLGLVATVLVGVAVLGLLAGGLRAAQGARTAADLAALAAAQSLAVPEGVRLAADVPRPGTAACDLAAEVATRNGAALAQCTAAATGVVTVTVARPGPFGSASGTARAGPRLAD